METKITDDYIEYCRIIRHSLGIDHFKKAYRNYFHASEDSDMHKILSEMEKLGLAEEYQRTLHAVYYRMTDKAISLVGYKETTKK